MKAIPFLELMKCWNEGELQHSIMIPDLINFYSQSFRPEMITEYFEGWESRSHNSFIYHNIKNDCKISIGKIIIIYYGLKGTLDIYTPTTLNDLISDCQRAGITREWKPEIETKYFK
jgi:hypothetical protein